MHLPLTAPVGGPRVKDSRPHPHGAVEPTPRAGATCPSAEMRQWAGLHDGSQDARLHGLIPRLRPPLSSVTGEREVYGLCQKATPCIWTFLSAACDFSDVVPLSRRQCSELLKMLRIPLASWQ